MEEQFESIIIYMLMFLTSIALFWIGQKLYDYGSRIAILGKIILFLAVLVPSILAGVRANSVTALGPPCQAGRGEGLMRGRSNTRLSFFFSFFLEGAFIVS